MRIALNIMKKLKLYPDAHIEVFPKMNHGQLLVDHPEEIADRISRMVTFSPNKENT